MLKVYVRCCSAMLLLDLCFKKPTKNLNGFCRDQDFKWVSASYVSRSSIRLPYGYVGAILGQFWGCVEGYMG